MKIKFLSSVIFTKDFEKMKSFYQDVLKQEVEVDFGNCIGFKNGLSIWRLDEGYPVAQHLGKTYDASGNKNLELCFESDEFNEAVEKLKSMDIKYLHEVIEERWGQQTIRFYDPEDNLIELGETMPCFVKRFYKQGMTIDEVVERTSVPKEMVEQYIKE